MKTSPFPATRPRHSSVFSPTRRVRFAVLVLTSLVSASFFGAAPKPWIVAQTKTTAPAPVGGIAGGPDVFDVSKLDRAPELKLRVQAQYPFEMRRAGVTGEVIVEFIVDTNGNVVNASVVRSSRVEFEANAVAAVSKWKFKPGQKAGRTVNTRMQVPIVFTLSDRD